MAIYLDTTQCIPYYIEPDTQGAASVYLSDLFLRIRRQELKGGGRMGQWGLFIFKGMRAFLSLGTVNRHSNTKFEFISPTNRKMVQYQGMMLS